MPTATVQNVDRSTLSEEEKNALAILVALPIEQLNALKSAMHLTAPGVIGPQTIAAFAQLAAAPPASLDLSDAGVNAFKTAHALGNAGPAAGAIGAQTAGVYYTAVTNALAGGGNGGVRRINDRGLSLIKNFEGYAQQIPGTTNVKAYPDPGTGGDPWTIGYGHTGPDVHPGLVITQAQATALLLSDLRVAESGVTQLVTVPLTDNQFAALVSFVYNLGAGALGESTLLRLLNARNYTGAAGEFGKWVNAGGQTLPGLVTRRSAERTLFLTP